MLGSEAIRFSSRPSLGGRAVVAEILLLPSGEAELRLFRLSGHWRTRWDMKGAQTFSLPPPEYRRLAGQVDAAIAAYRPPYVDPDNGEFIICTDGPGFLTERLRAGQVTTLVGQCPPKHGVLHPNRTIAASIDAVLCTHVRPAIRRGPFGAARCRRR
ncbi:MAG TPA: hypothetical protein VGB79_08620 [Allosphingosinicella sp.]